MWRDLSGLLATTPQTPPDGTQAEPKERDGTRFRNPREGLISIRLEDRVIGAGKRNAIEATGVDPISDGVAKLQRRRRPCIGEGGGHESRIGG